MSKNITERISNLKKNPDVKGPIRTYQFKNDTVEIYFSGKSNYFQSLISNNTLHAWEFDRKTNQHLILMTEEYYERYQSLYSEEIVQENLRFFHHTDRLRNRNMIFTLLGVFGVAALAVMFVILFPKINFLAFVTPALVILLAINFVVVRITAKQIKKLRDKYYEIIFETRADLKELSETQHRFTEVYIEEYYKEIEKHEKQLILDSEKFDEEVLEEEMFDAEDENEDE